MGEKIYIDSYTGGSVGEDLINCYFKYKANDLTWTFHDKDDHSKCTGLKVGSTCSFTLDELPGITWTITLTSPCTSTEVNGNWVSVTDDNTQEGGTFQAQDGGGVAAGENVNVQKPQQDLVIHEITSHKGTDYGDPLKGCSFTLAGNSGKYKFRDPDGGVLHPDVTWNDTFHFTYLNQNWKISSDIHTIEQRAHGSWSLLEGDTEEVDGGTFQAQAGGGGGADEGTAYAATA